MPPSVSATGVAALRFIAPLDPLDEAHDAGFPAAVAEVVRAHLGFAGLAQRAAGGPTARR